MPGFPVAAYLPRLASTHMDLHAGMSRCGLSYETLADNVVVAFHGTSGASAQRVLCEGFDPAKRGLNGQAHGPGEYFAEDWATADGYARRHFPSVVIVAAVIGTKVIRDGRWHVVNNPHDRSVTYALTLAYIPINGLLPRCPRCSCSAVQYIDDVHRWASMAPEDALEVRRAYRSGYTRVHLGRWTYRYDWHLMTQTNVQTNRTRNIRFL